MGEPIVIEPTADGEPARPRITRPPRAPRPLLALIAVAAVIGATVLVVGVVGDDGSGRRSPDVADGDREVAPVSGPDAARVCDDVEPRELRAAFDAVGGFDGLRLGEIEGAFDVVTFDPDSHDTLLAAHRSGYGPAENQDDNERWVVSGGEVARSIWNRSVPHDFAHFNTDGTVTMWVHGGGDGYAPRSAVVLDRDGSLLARTAPMHADRFAADAGTVFALVGDPDRFAPRDTGYLELVADDGVRRTRLRSASDLAWIDVPARGVLVAYPADPTAGTIVWDTSSLEPIPEHPLAGGAFRRVAISGDGSTAVGVDGDGRLVRVDLGSGASGTPFGFVDVTEVDRPVVLSVDGTIALTVDRSGPVSIWHTATGELIAEHGASAGLPRWLATSRSAARVTSALAPDGRRVALRIDARPGVEVSWLVVDTDVVGWTTRAGITGC